MGDTLWPASTPTASEGSASPATLGTQFGVSSAAPLIAVKFWSPETAVALPSICGVWDVATQSLVTVDPTPQWLLADGETLAVAGDGWTWCMFTAAAVTLVPDNPYAVSVYQPGSVQWYAAEADYFTSGAGAAGIGRGLVNAPNSSGSVNGQGCTASAVWEFPATSGDGTAYFVDVEVQSASSSSRMLLANII